jgi:tRNA pseudouridine38-40 synthase
MPRYFLELSYKGTRYSGFQIQDNAATIQMEVENALHTLFAKPIALTGSSRTDAGVHAKQNFFHFDIDETISPQKLYNINALLPNDIAAKNLYEVAPEAHCRFDAVAREYEYVICKTKDPFLQDRAWFYPYQINEALLQEAAAALLQYNDFTSFSKRNTQVYTFICEIQQSQWEFYKDTLVYRVKANRFLRGMVRGIVGTMLKTARHQTAIATFKEIIEAKDCTKADFSTPPHGLFLTQVHYPESLGLVAL